MTTKWNPVASSSHPSSGPSTSYAYYTGTNKWRDRVKTITDARGFRTTYEYDRTFDANGDQTMTACSGRGLITKVSYPDDTHGGTISGGTSMSYVYDIYGNLLSETQDQLAETTKYTYDEYNRLRTMKLPDSDSVPNQRATIYDYTPNRSDPPNGINPLSHTSNSIWKETAPSLVVTARTFDENFRLSSEKMGSQDPSVAATTWFGYDNYGNQMFVTDPRGSGPGDVTYTTSTDYDTRNRKMQVRPPAVPVTGVEKTQWEYDPNGNVTRIVRADATVESKEYDTMNRVMKDTQPKQPGVTAVTQMDYYPAGTLKTLTDARSRVTTFFYNETDLKSQVSYPPNSQGVSDYESYEYDQNYNLLNRRTTSNVYQVFEYDERNRQKSMSWHDGKTVSTPAHQWANGFYDNTYAYDAAGRLTQANNANSAVTRVWDKAGRLKSEKQTYQGATFTAPLLKYTYRQDGKVKRLYVGPGETYDFNLDYDGMARLSTLMNNEDTAVDYQYGYDRASNVTSRVNNINGTGVVYTVDQLNRITQRDINLPSAIFSRETYSFDARDRVTDVRRDETLTKDHFDYDQMGEITLAQYGTPVTPTPTPSATPTPTASPSPTPGTQVAPVRIYDNGYQQGQPMPVYMTTDTSGATIFYTRKPKTCPADPTHDSNGNATGETLVYDPAAPPTIVPGAGAIFSAVGYKAGLADSEITQCINEDNVQLSPLSGPTRTVSYVWDKVGNRNSVTDSAVNGGAPQNYVTNALNQYNKVNNVPLSNGPAHEIAGYDNVSYAYMGDTYLAQASFSPNIYTLFYDALGRVVKRVRSNMGLETTTYYLFDGEHWILEYKPNGTPQSSNLYGLGIDEIVARYNAAAPEGAWEQWPYPDRNGNTSVVTGGTNGGATLLEYYRYDAFGQPTIYDPSNDSIRSTTAIANRFLFTGREWNPEFNFYEYRARAYSPSLGRFMSEDPKGFEAGDYNLFRYVGNDPLDRTDPMGLFDVGFEGAGTFSLRSGATSDTAGNVALREYIASRGGQVFGRSQAGQRQALAAIKAMLGKNPNEPINVTGYSRGATAANSLAGKAGGEGITIKHEILIDPVSALGQPQSLKVPSNVERADNYYQKSGGPFRGGPAANPSSSVVNHDVSGPGIDHNSVVKEVLQTQVVFHTGSLIPERQIVPQKTSQ